ncbi:hypothetical protein KY348_03320 [Candidatus Woesearchaeota archaeon]|nr:hypothetical protein [Candidatus Woesearchaeota archaeon]
MKQEIIIKKQREKDLAKLSKKIMVQVEKSLGVNLDKLQKNLLSSYNPREQKIERFFRDVYNTPTTKKGLRQISEDYLQTNMSDQDLEYLLSNTNERNKIAEQIKNEFQINFRKGEYHTKSIPVEALDDVADLLEGLENPSDRYVLIMYYGFSPDEKTYTLTEIGDHLDLTTERIRQLRNRGLRKVRANGGRTLAVKYANFADIPNQTLDFEEEIKILKAEVQERNIMIKDIITSYKSRRNNVYKIPVADLDLSVRAANGLARLECETIGDIIVNQDKFRYVKNLGRKSLIEIKEAIVEKGVKPTAIYTF